jgi:hypothetical protein
MRIGAGRAVALLATGVALLGALAGCAVAPRSLGLRDTTITQSLPIGRYREVWLGVPLNNATGAPITMRSLALTGVRNLTVGTPFVIEIQPGGVIDWYAPPGTKAMQAEVSRRRPFAGFVVPPHSKRRFQAVVLVRAGTTGRAASTTGAVVGYSGGLRWNETWTERSALRLGR